MAMIKHSKEQVAVHVLNSVHSSQVPQVAELNSSLRGAAGELLVAADLIKCGFEVFHGFSGRESCDLIALKNCCVWRIEVKTSDPHIWYVANLPDPQKHDVIAFANIRTGDVGYSDGPADFLATVDPVHLARIRNNLS